MKIRFCCIFKNSFWQYSNS